MDDEDRCRLSGCKTGLPRDVCMTCHVESEKKARQEMAKDIFKDLDKMLDIRQDPTMLVQNPIKHHQIQKLKQKYGVML